MDNLSRAVVGSATAAAAAVAVVFHVIGADGRPKTSQCRVEGRAKSLTLAKSSSKISLPRGRRGLPEATTPYQLYVLWLRRGDCRMFLIFDCPLVLQKALNNRQSQLGDQLRISQSIFAEFPFAVAPKNDPWSSNHSLHEVMLGS